MPTDPLISAIVSTYNSERFIGGCLADLQAQTMAQQLEIIVIDSGSRQNEGAIVKEFQKRYQNITYIRTERESLYAAWNRGIKMARGKYITNANTDDRHHPRALEILAGTLDKHPECVLAYADVKVTGQENATFYNAPINGCFKWPNFDQRLLFNGCYVGNQPLWRKEVHDRYGFFDPSFLVAGDYEFWLRIAQGERFIHVPQILGLYFLNPGGLEHSQRSICREESEIARIRHWPVAQGPLPEFCAGYFVSNYYINKFTVLGKLIIKIKYNKIMYQIYQNIFKV